MKSNEKKIIRIIVLGLVLTIASVSYQNFSDDQSKNKGDMEIRYETEIKNPGNSGYWTLNFIYIDDNWSDTAIAYDWCSGDGSWGNPYTIENVTIDASSSPTGSGIFINNSKNDYFIIRNCTVYNAGSGTYDGGIKLENTNNGTLTNNNCSDNGWCGILLFNYCGNCTVSGNIANNNENYGIWLQDDCDSNIISGNTASNIGTSNQNVGIYLNLDCDNNIISGNTANDNGGLGIQLDNYCDNNTISGNTANDNGGLSSYDSGIYLDDCEDNTISGNIANNNDDYGIFLENGCNDNTISGNTVNTNGGNGIFLLNGCLRNTISGNTANDNNRGIYLYNSNYNIVSGNTANNNIDYGIALYHDCNNNNISGNLIKNNLNNGIRIYYNGQNNLIYQNSLIGNTLHAIDDGTNNHWDNSLVGNYWDNHTSPDSDNDGIVDIPYTWIASWAGSVDNFPLVYSPVHLGEKIHIDDSGVSAWNWSKTAKLKWWCIGTGTYDDPYIINGLEVDGGGSGNGILIEDSSIYFIIKDCTVYNAGSGTYDGGIKLENTNNGILTNNTCSNNLRNGIFLFNYCKNNTVLGNTVYLNDEGINIVNYCDLNIISENDARFNVHNGIRAYGYSDNNSFSGNTARNNGMYGIVLDVYSNNNSISESITLNNVYPNIGILGECDDNVISGNLANDSRHGIYLWRNNNNIVLGNTVNDNNYYGIFLSNDSNNNTISGNTANDNYHGIYLSNCDYNSITGNTANNNSYHGIYLSNCDNNIITGNTANDDNYGIYLRNSYSAELSGNNMKNCGVMVEGSFTQVSSHMIYSNNTVNGRFLYYYVNESGLDAIDFTGGGQVILFYCNNSVISNLNLSHTSIGIFLYHCYDNTILNNIANNNKVFGICLKNDCDGNTISGNTANDNGETGIYIYDNCHNNTILGNIANDNYYGIILIYNCDNNTILGNTANDNYYGIILMDNCDNNTISENTVNGNSVTGIIFIDEGVPCKYNDLTGNILYNNTIGIYLETGSNNSLYENFFLKNGKHAFDDGMDNTWNSTTIGNYWDNHTSPDSDNDGIVDLPYNISGSTASKDYLPIAEDGAPTIDITSPTAGDIFGVTAPSFNVRITDDYLYEMWYTLDGGLHNYTFTVNDTIDQSVWDAMPDGTIPLKFHARDIPGNIGSAEVNIIKDTEVPIIIINSPNSGDKFGNNAPTFDVTITDDHLDTMWYTINNESTKYFFIINGTIDQTAWSTLPEGTVTIRFYANDIAGNLASEEVDITKSIPEEADFFMIVIISIVGGAAIIIIILVIIIKKRKPPG